MTAVVMEVSISLRKKPKKVTKNWPKINAESSAAHASPAAAPQQQERTSFGDMLKLVSNLSRDSFRLVGHSRRVIGQATNAVLKPVTKASKWFLRL